MEMLIIRVQATGKVTEEVKGDATFLYQSLVSLASLYQFHGCLPL